MNTNKDASHQDFEKLKVCVIIPTYNNAATIDQVVSSVLEYTSNIIVVNDGATDGTEQVLEKYHKNIELVRHPTNSGKGKAIQTGFKRAVLLGYKYAITIDSDGQHFASDLPVFINTLKETGPALIMGARNMDQESVPGKSSFGNKFSNFWYRVETGIRLPDTQTGYRLYPLEPIKKMRFFTQKFEFEIEIIVRLAWSGVKVVAAPISVYYPPPGERVSHFRPFKDFTRISGLNTVLVTIAFLYIWPRNFFRFFFRNKNWKQQLKQILLRPGESDLTKANSVAFGGFMGILPVWGFQLLIGLPAAHFLRLNKPLFLIAAHISIPPLIPFIVFLSFVLGKPFMGSRGLIISFSRDLNLKTIWLHIEQYIYGALLLAVVTAMLFWVATYLFLRVYRKTRTIIDKYNQ